MIQWQKRRKRILTGWTKRNFALGQKDSRASSRKRNSADRFAKRLHVVATTKQKSRGEGGEGVGRSGITKSVSVRSCKRDSERLEIGGRTTSQWTPGLCRGCRRFVLFRGGTNACKLVISRRDNAARCVSGMTAAVRLWIMCQGWDTDEPVDV